MRQSKSSNTHSILPELSIDNDAFTRRLREIIKPSHKILEIITEPWFSIIQWLDENLYPNVGRDVPFSSLQDCLKPWKSQVVTVEEDPCDNPSRFWQTVCDGVEMQSGKPDAKSDKNNPLPLFDIIVVTPLLTSPGWRIGIAHLLRLLKPGGTILVSELKGDALLLDGRVAEWVRWTKQANRRKDRLGNLWTHTVSRLFLQIEQECNRPWIPELSFCQAESLFNVLKYLGGKITPPAVQTVMLHFRSEQLPALLDFYTMRAYLSPVESTKLKADFKGSAPRANERPIHFDFHWHCVEMPPNKTNCMVVKGQKFFQEYAITDAILHSLSSYTRNLLDSPHYLLPTFEATKAERGGSDKATMGVTIEERILRSLRGFVCRMIHHDRFDPDHYHLFVASLWEPNNTHIAHGNFAKATGLIFRSTGSDKNQIADEALRQIAYLAHSRWNAIKANQPAHPFLTDQYNFESVTLQTIPQMLFDTARPTMRVVIGDDWGFEFHVPKQLDSPDINYIEVETRSIVPAQITITMPDFDADGEKWRLFRQEYFDGESGVLQEMYSTKHEVATLEERFRREIWTVYEGKLYSFPWNASRIGELSSADAPFVEKLERGEVAGLIMSRLIDRFIEHGNILARNLEVEDPEEYRENCHRKGVRITNPYDYERFEKGLIGLLRELNIPKNKRKALSAGGGRKIFRALVALTLAFPIGKGKKEWELIQVPVGAFLHSDENSNAVRFVSAGSSMLVRQRSVDPGFGQEDEDARLRQELAQIRATQLMRHVPTVLLPLSSLLLVNRLSKEQIESSVRYQRAESARGLLHNLRNLISPALSRSELLRNEFDDWFGNARAEIDAWEKRRWWREGVSPDASMYIEGWRDIFREHVTRAQEYLGQREASAKWVKRTLDAYYSYLSGDGPSMADRGDIVEVYHDTLAVVWETWIDPSTWMPSDDYHLRPGISDETWKERKYTLVRLRSEAAALSPEPLLPQGRWSIFDEHISVNWKCNISSQDIHFSTIAFHVLYELLWNGLKYMVKQKVLFRDENLSQMSIDLDISKQSESQILITYSQSCPNEEVREKLIEILLDSAEIDRSEFRGLRSIPPMVHRCHWKIHAFSENDRLNVHLQIPIIEKE